MIAGQMDGDRQIVEDVDRQIDRQIDRQVDVCMYIDRQIGRRMNVYRQIEDVIRYNSKQVIDIEKYIVSQLIFDKHLKLYKRYCFVNTLLRTFINIFVTIIFNSKKFKLWEANIVSEIINGAIGEEAL